MQPSPNKFVTVLFGPLGDALMALAFFDDLHRLAPDSTLLILTRHGAKNIRQLAREYSQIEVREIPRGIAALPFFWRVVMQRSTTLLTLGLVSVGYSLPLRLFFLGMRLTGHRTIGFHDSFLHVHLNFDIKYLMIENLRRLLPYILGKAGEGMQPPPRLNLPQEKPTNTPEPKKYILAHLFGASIPHALPPERWHELFLQLSTAHPEFIIILTGVPAQRKIAEEIIAGLPNAQVRTDLSMPQLTWLVANAALYIGIDTGVTHIAGLLQQKSVVVRHCSDPTWTPSYNPNARVLYNPEHCTPNDPAACVMVEIGGRHYRRCALDIPDEELLKAVEQALK